MSSYLGYESKWSHPPLSVNVYKNGEKIALIKVFPFLMYRVYSNTVG